ncbi:MAG: DnaJ domain-containing protein [Chthoniobacteraceae bacterium]
MEPTQTDHYATLGLDRRCTEAQIRNAYRLLAKRHHPDVNGGAEEAAERLKAINGAHEVLSDPARRAAYDRELSEMEQEAPPPRRVKIEKNIVQDAHLRIEDFLRGTTLKVKVNDPANPNGVEIYELVVPSDTAPGTRFKLPRNEPFADGFVQVRVKALPGARFKARGSDLRCDLRISAQRAANGGTEMIPGPSWPHAQRPYSRRGGTRRSPARPARRSAQATRRTGRPAGKNHLSPRGDDQPRVNRLYSLKKRSGSLSVRETRQTRENEAPFFA